MPLHNNRLDRSRILPSTHLHRLHPKPSSDPGSTPSKLPLLTLYFLDSHGQTPNKFFSPDYDPIKQSQIDWFVNTSQALRNAREKEDDGQFHLSLAFLHIPLPEFGDCHLRICNGHRREPTESPSVNSHFYDALVRESISALGCGHDHVNDFCALLHCDKSILYNLYGVW